MGRPRTRELTAAELDRQRELATDPIRLAVVARVTSLGLSPEQVESLSGGRISHDTVNRYLQGTAAPTAVKLSVLLELLGWDGKLKWVRSKQISQKCETPG